MTAAIDSATPPVAVFHPDSDALHFWVDLPDGRVMGASISSSVLHYRFQGRFDGGDAVAIYEANRRAIEAAVLRRAAAGSREPVMLREHDLPRSPKS